MHGIHVVIFGTVDSAHHSLVITEKKDGERSDAVDRYEKTTLLQLVGDI